MYHWLKVETKIDVVRKTTQNAIGFYEHLLSRVEDDENQLETKEGEEEATNDGPSCIVC